MSLTKTDKPKTFKEYILDPDWKGSIMVFTRLPDPTAHESVNCINSIKFTDNVQILFAEKKMSVKIHNFSSVRFDFNLDEKAPGGPELKNIIRVTSNWNVSWREPHPATSWVLELTRSEAYILFTEFLFPEISGQISIYQ